MPADNISPERIQEIANEWIGYGFSTHTNRQRAEALVPDVYIAVGLKPPAEIIWADSPLAGAQKARQIFGAPLPDWRWNSGPLDAPNMAMYATMIELGYDEYKIHIPSIEMAKVCGAYFILNDVCILTLNPIRRELDSDKKLHCENGKALEYSDGFGFYFIHGNKVDEKIIKHPELVTIDDIKKESRDVVRRFMVSRHGWVAKYNKKDGGDNGRK